MAAVDGNEIGVLIGSTLMGYQKGLSISRNADMLDVSTKADDDAVFLPSKRTMTVDCDAFYVSGDGAYGDLVTAYEAGSAVTVVWTDNANAGSPTTVKTGSAYVSSLSLSAPAHGPAEISISLQVSGNVT